MNTLHAEERASRFIRLCLLILGFLGAALGVFLLLYQDTAIGGTRVSRAVYLIGGAMLLAGLLTRWLTVLRTPEEPRTRRAWYCPLMAALLTLAVALLAYAYLGIWPLGDKTVMVVDMHHQYAPLLSELRSMLLEGGSFTYSFHLGLGANFIPAFAYYLASPLNLLLVLFPPAYLAEGIFVIMILKTALAAAAFAACAQYLFRRRNAAIIALSMLYALMTYMLAYSWNVMWLDVVALAPLVVLCLERMLRGGGLLAYAGTLALALFANYYIGFMLCVFLVLYFAVWLLRERRSLTDVLRGGGRFAAGSLLGGGLAAALLVPTALALGRTSAAGDGMKEFAANFDLFDLFGNLFYGAEPTIRSGNLPNLYCGVLVVLLVPLYLSVRPIPLRRRLSYGGLAVLLLLSCTINQWDLLWHGLHTPNDLPYRFSFLVCFVLLLLAGEVLRHLSSLTPTHILASLGGSAAYLVLWEKLGGEEGPADTLIYINLLLLAAYAAVLLFTLRRKLPMRAGRLLVLVLVAAELLTGTAQSLTAINGNEYYTSHNNYVDNAGTVANTLAVERAQEIAQEEGQVFTRLEFLPRSTCMDTALYHYPGITTFASSNPYRTTLLMGDLGYAINGVNSYLYKSFVASADSLFAIRYVILDFKLESHPQLTLLESVEAEGVYRYIYRNERALPVGVFATNGVRTFAAPSYAPFTAQEDLYAALTGVEERLYEPLPLESTSYSSTIAGHSFVKNQTDASVVYAGEVTEAGQYFAFVDCRAADSIMLDVYDEDSQHKNNWSVTTYEPFIVDLGTLQPGSRVETFIEGEGTFTGNVYVVRLEDEALQAQIGRLTDGGVQVTAHSDTGLTGTVKAPEDGALFFSIPYDTGWTVTVDGQTAETFPIAKEPEGTDGALLGVSVSAGQHTVELSYRAPGQTVGLLISLASLLTAAGILLFPKLKKRLNKGKV